MAMTPESKVKKAVRERLEHYGLVRVTKAADTPERLVNGFFFMPLAGPGSVWGIHDFIGCWRGLFFTIETKAPNNPVDATESQLAFQTATQKAGGISFVGVRSADAVDQLAAIIHERIQNP